METKLQLHGFNNLTKSLSFNIYDICYAQTEEQREAYIDYIDEMYNAERLTQIPHRRGQDHRCQRAQYCPSGL